MKSVIHLGKKSGDFRAVPDIQPEPTLKVETVETTETIKPKRKVNKKLLIGLLILFIVLSILGGLAIYFIVLPAQRVLTYGHNIEADFRNFKSDLDNKDISKIDTYVADINDNLANINTEVNKYQFLKDIDLTKGYYQNLVVVQDLTHKAQDLVTFALPDLKDIFVASGYKVTADAAIPAGTDPNTQQINSLISELPKIVTLYDQIEPQILDIIKVFNQLDTNYIPNVGSQNLGEEVAKAQKLTSEFPSISAQLKNTLGILPKLLGSETPANYLILFQNEKELRSSGGIFSAYGNLKIDKGEMVGDIKATDLWILEGYVSYTLGIDVGYSNIYGQNALMNDGCGSTYLRAQDSGIYPDLFVSIDMFKDYYNVAHQYDPEDYPAYDSIIIVNTFFASDLISLVEPVEIPDTGITITAENAAKQIFAQTSSGPFDPTVRKDFIGKVATAVKNKFNELSSSDFSKVGETLIRTLQAKNLALYSLDPTIQAYADEYGISGRIEHNFDGDYFNLGEAQNCALKANFYVRDSVVQNVNIADDGSISRQVKTTWWNDKVYDSAEENILSNNESFLYRAWVRYFVPQGSVIESTDGFEKSQYFYWPVDYYDEKMQKEVSDNVIWFDERRQSESDPIPSIDLNVSYTLPDTIKYTDQDGYRLLIQKHPGKKDEKYTINILYNGVTTSADVVLDRDKVITFKHGVISVDNFDKRLDDYYDLLQQLDSSN